MTDERLKKIENNLGKMTPEECEKLIESIKAYMQNFQADYEEIVEIIEGIVKNLYDLEALARKEKEDD